MNLGLFPKNEEWGSGDEAIDSRLNFSLKKTADHLTLFSIAEFYSFAQSQKTRAYNPHFMINIELVVKALLYYLSPEECNDILFKKVRGHYYSKERVVFQANELSKMFGELQKNKRVRYADVIDFTLHQQSISERNPFVEYELKKSPVDLQSRIILKELRFFLNGLEVENKYQEALLKALQFGRKILVIEPFAEIWYDSDQLYSFNL